MNTFASPSTMTIFRANQWIDILTHLDHALKGKVGFDKDGFVNVMRKISGRASREEMARPVMAMFLERYRYHVVEGGELTIRLMSNGAKCAPTVSDGINMEMFLAGIECNLGGVYVDPCLPITYPDAAEIKLAKQLMVLQTILVRMELGL